MNRQLEHISNGLTAHNIEFEFLPISQIDLIKKSFLETMNDFPLFHGAVKHYTDNLVFHAESFFEAHSKEAQSILTVAIPQPLLQIAFEYQQRTFKTLLPPMYLLDSSIIDEPFHEGLVQLQNILQACFNPLGYSVYKTNLPAKISAALSGLGQYGRNNLCYIRGQHSYYWLGTYLTDFPFSDDMRPRSLSNIKTYMPACENCNLCLGACPENALGRDRFQLHPERCLTLHNEKSSPFPGWIDSKSHNALIGCIRCQIVCPQNRKNAPKASDGVAFTSAETEQFLSRIPITQLSPSTIRKLKSINFIQCYDILEKNLRALIEKHI